MPWSSRPCGPSARGSVEIWTAETDEAVAAINGLLAEHGALPRLVRHGDWDWHLHATPPEAPLATRMAVEAAMALVDVVRSGEMARLGVCAAEDCDDVVIDLSKNRSRRYCEKGCGNRANVAAYRARKSRTSQAFSVTRKPPPRRRRFSGEADRSRVRRARGIRSGRRAPAGLRRGRRRGW